MCFSASPGGSKPTLKCRCTVSLAKRDCVINRKYRAKLQNQLKKLSAKRVHNNTEIKKGEKEVAKSTEKLWANVSNSTETRWRI